MSSPLLNLIGRTPAPEPWSEGEKIPWNEEGFSRRMLKEHLTQAHDRASRRFEIIDQQIAWIRDMLLKQKPLPILDLGCGPGFYTSRLAQFGHICTGIDFSPASIEYAQQQATEQGLTCRYIHGDLRTAEFGTGYGLVMMIFGEINVFQPDDALFILRKAFEALDRDGLLLLEPHTFDTIYQVGHQPSTWYSAESGLFSEQPHLCLYESFWNATRNVATERYFIIEAEPIQVQRHAASMQAYTSVEYETLLEDCGFREVTFYPSLTGQPSDEQSGLFALVARK
jgi:SAM-dependent methyltransferase